MRRPVKSLPAQYLERPCCERSLAEVAAADCLAQMTGRPTSEMRLIFAWAGVISVAAAHVHAALNAGRSLPVTVQNEGTVLAIGSNTTEPTTSKGGGI